MIIKIIPVIVLTSLMLSACGSTSSSDSDTTSDSTNEIALDYNNAAVRAVSISGELDRYTFSVTVESPDTGCSQYADWWEVLRADGSLVYRRILSHSHVTEQPFARSGGPVQVTDNENIIVRAHMNNIGYGEQVFTGSIANGLTMVTIESSFMEDLAFVDPIPADCAF